MSVDLSLTQFLTYSAKVSTSARVSCVREIKNSPDYDPSIDYWKKLRDAIKRTHEKDLPIETLLELPNQVSDKKSKNYQRAVNKYVNFIKKNKATYFTAGKSYWSFEDQLNIKTSPEIGLEIDGKKYLVKNYYKKPEKNTKVTRRNIRSTLTMMQLSTADFEKSEDMTYAVLNLQNGTLIESSPLVSDSVLELEIDARTFVDIWNRI